MARMRQSPKHPLNQEEVRRQLSEKDTELSVLKELIKSTKTMTGVKDQEIHSTCGDLLGSRTEGENEEAGVGLLGRAEEVPEPAGDLPEHAGVGEDRPEGAQQQLT